MSLAVSVRIIGFLSIILALALAGVSAWMLKETYDDRQSLTGDIKKGISGFTKTLDIYRVDPDKIDRIKIGVAAASLAAGILQLITSVVLLFCTSSRGGRLSACLWLFVNLFVILACAGSFICIVSQKFFQEKLKNDDPNHQLKAFLGVTGADAIFLFLFSFVTGAFGCRSG